MRITEIVWLDAFEEKCWVKHGVGTDEVAEVFAASPRVLFVENGYRKGEDIYAAQGRRMLAVI